MLDGCEVHLFMIITFRHKSLATKCDDFGTKSYGELHMKKKNKHRLKC